jgi:hypothetical protein
MEMSKYLKKFLKHTAVTAAIASGAFFAPAADAGYVVYQWSNQGNNALPMGISQADAARLAKTFERVGECEAYEDACLAAFVAYYKPQDLPNIKTLSAKDKGNLKKWTEAELKKYAAARSNRQFGISFPQPYNANGNEDGSLSRYGRSVSQMGGGRDFPYGFNITDGEAVFENGRMNSAKTKFRGRYEDILPIAVYNGMLYDAAGLLSGELDGQVAVNPLYPMIGIFTNANSNIYRVNADGKDVLTPQDKGPASQYRNNRFQGNASPKDAIEYMNRKNSKIRFDEAWIRQTIKKLVNGVLASPVSRQPARPARGNVRAG